MPQIPTTTTASRPGNMSVASASLGFTGRPLVMKPRRSRSPPPPPDQIDGTRWTERQKVRPIESRINIERTINTIFHSGGSDTRADVAPVLAPPAGTTKVLSFCSVYTIIYQESCRPFVIASLKICFEGLSVFIFCSQNLPIIIEPYCFFSTYNLLKLNRSCHIGILLLTASSQVRTGFDMSIFKSPSFFAIESSALSLKK